MDLSTATDAHARFQVIKQDIEDLKSEVRDRNIKIDILIKSFGIQSNDHSNSQYNTLNHGVSEIKYTVNKENDNNKLVIW